MDIPPEDGIVSPASESGEISRNRPITSRSNATPYVATRRHGSSFSTAMIPAMNAIQVMLMTPRANNAAISAQQHPTHQAPILVPMRSAPTFPSRQDPSSSPSGLLHLPRQTSFSGVSS